MSGKGDDRRRQSVDDKTFASNWRRIFGPDADPGERNRIMEEVCEKASERQNKLLGCSSTVEPASLKRPDVRSNRTTPANSEVMEDFRRFWDAQAPRAKDAHGAFSCVYIDNATGQEVSEDWWPGDEPKT